MPLYTPYKLFVALLWSAERALQEKNFYALRAAVHLLAELAQEDLVKRKLNGDERLTARWDKVWRATLGSPDRQVKPPVALVESLLEAAEIFLEDSDWYSARAILPKLALLEAVHGVEGLFPGRLAERVDAVRMALKDHRG